MAPKWRCTDVYATSSRRIDASSTSFQRCVPAGVRITKMQSRRLYVYEINYDRTIPTVACSPSKDSNQPEPRLNRVFAVRFKDS